MKRNWNLIKMEKDYWKGVIEEKDLVVGTVWFISYVVLFEIYCSAMAWFIIPTMKDSTINCLFCGAAILDIVVMSYGKIKDRISDEFNEQIYTLYTAPLRLHWMCFVAYYMLHYIKAV